MNYKRVRDTEEKKSIYMKIKVIFLSAIILSLAVFWMDNSRELPRNEEGEQVLERNPHGKGTREETYKVQVGEEEEILTMEIGEQMYTEKELRQLFSNAGEALPKLILAKNQSLDEIRDDLTLIQQVPDTGIQVSWEIDNYEVMDLQGRLKRENLVESGTLVKLKAVLSYGEEKAEYIFYANVFPPLQSSRQEFFERIQKEVADRDRETQEKKELSLPGSIDGISVRWKYPIQFRAVAVLMIGVAAAMFLYVSEKQKQKEKIKNKEQQMIWDYPQMVNRFTLLLGAGMTTKNVWQRIVEEYELSKSKKGKREVYEEMSYTLHEMKGGVSETECYEHFGRRCKLTAYRKFAAMLSQNLKKGTKGLTIILRQEAEQAFEDRKNMARRLGEEAGTKMLLPMFLMLAVVLVIMVVPAFFTIAIQD